MRVLIVDDDSELRALVRRILGPRRYEIVEIESGEQALAVIEGPHERFDVVISDVLMPGIDGYALVARIQGLVGAVILMSGYPENPAKLRSNTSFLSKPFTPQGLRTCFEQVLARERAR